MSIRMAVATATHHSYDRMKTKGEPQFFAMYCDASVLEEPDEQCDDWLVPDRLEQWEAVMEAILVPQDRIYGLTVLFPCAVGCGTPWGETRS